MTSFIVLCGLVDEVASLSTGVARYLRVEQACVGTCPQSSAIAARHPSTAPGVPPAAALAWAPEHIPPAQPLPLSTLRALSQIGGKPQEWSSER